MRDFLVKRRFFEEVMKMNRREIILIILILIVYIGCKPKEPLDESGNGGATQTLSGQSVAPSEAAPGSTPADQIQMASKEFPDVKNYARSKSLRDAPFTRRMKPSVPLSKSYEVSTADSVLAPTDEEIPAPAETATTNPPQAKPAAPTSTATTQTMIKPLTPTDTMKMSPKVLEKNPALLNKAPVDKPPVKAKVPPKPPQ